MIKVFALINKLGNIRMTKFYDPAIKDKDKTRILQEIFDELNRIESNSANFIGNSEILGEEVNIVYREYGTLYFVLVVEENESELAMIDIIQVILDILEKVFRNLSEQDVMNNPQKVNLILDEIIMKGTVIESSTTEIMEILKQYKIEGAKR